MKTCSRCNVPQDLSKFPKNRRKKDGYDPSCKACTNQRMRDRYAADPQFRAEKIRKTRQYHLDHPEWSKERLRAHHVTHRAERALAAVERERDPVVAAARREATRRAEQRRRAYKVASPQVELITEEALAERLAEFDGQCYICNRAFSDTIKLHWDHFHPLSRGGVHAIENLFPACGPCNIRKNATWPVSKEFLALIKSDVLAPALVSQTEGR